MQEDALHHIKATIKAFHESLKGHLPALEQEINALIEHKVEDKNRIEHSLDTLLSLTEMGVCEDLFVKLLDYYKTIDAAGAAFYWEQFDGEE